MQMNRDLDGVYFRVNVDGKWQNLCFTDLPDDKVEEVLKDRNDEWLISLEEILTNVLEDIIKMINSSQLDKISKLVKEKSVLLSLKERVLALRNVIRNIGEYYDIVGEIDG